MKKLFSIALVMLVGLIFTACGETTFDQIPYGEANISLQNLVLLYDDSKNRTDILTNMHLESFSNTYESGKEQISTFSDVKIGRYLQNPLVSITQDKTNTIYYLNKQMLNNSIVTPMTQTIDELITQIKEDYMKSLSVTSTVDGIYKKTFQDVTYYKVVYNSTYINSQEDITDRIIKNKGEAYPDYIISYSLEFGLNKNSFLVMTKISYTLQNHNRQNYYTFIQQTNLVDYSSNMTVVSDPSILNPMIR